MSLSAIGRKLDAPPWAVQVTLTGYLDVPGIGQLIAGPIIATPG